MMNFDLALLLMYAFFMIGVLAGAYVVSQVGKKK